MDKRNNGKRISFGKNKISMDKNNYRKFKRVDFFGDIRVHIVGEEKDISVSIKDISPKGMRILLGGRILKIGTQLGIKMNINERLIQCNGTIAWFLAIRPGLGNISIFDVGVEFTEINPQDQEFLEKLFG